MWVSRRVVGFAREVVWAVAWPNVTIAVVNSTAQAGVNVPILPAAYLAGPTVLPSVYGAVVWQSSSAQASRTSSDASRSSAAIFPGFVDVDLTQQRVVFASVLPSVVKIPQGESASVYLQLFEPPCDRAAGVLRDGVAPPAAEDAVQRVEWACRSANPQISCPPGLPQPTASPPISPEASSRLLLLNRGSRAVPHNRSESNGKAFILRDFQFAAGATYIYTATVTGARGGVAVVQLRVDVAAPVGVALWGGATVLGADIPAGLTAAEVPTQVDALGSTVGGVPCFGERSAKCGCVAVGCDVSADFPSKSSTPSPLPPNTNLEVAVGAADATCVGVGALSSAIAAYKVCAGTLSVDPVPLRAQFNSSAALSTATVGCAAYVAAVDFATAGGRAVQVSIHQGAHSFLDVSAD